jgi:uncharacterized protein YjbJ (UPF0337 family)
MALGPHLREALTHVLTVNPASNSGKAKQNAGRATDDDQLQAEGHADQAKVNLEQAGEKVEGAFKR